MLTPSEIALLRRDLQVALNVVGPDEIDDARRLISEIGLRNEDFDFSQRPDPLPEVPSPISGTMTVTRKSTGANRTYVVGSGVDWLGRFEVDLQARMFDFVPAHDPNQ